jgi:DNA repair protein RecN (Recombination protein N)
VRLNASAHPVSSTLIFDEVDAGIGGRVADVVGARLRGLGDHYQVLCITHLPQIAARGSTQFRIEKQVRGNRTMTSVQRLDDGERVEEIARMIGGAATTDAVRASARDLLSAGAGLERSRSAGPERRREAKGESESPGRRRKS